MFASTQVLTASALSPACASPVARCKLRPPTVTSVLARNVVTPAVAEGHVTEHSPVAPTVVHVGELNEPGPLSFVNVTSLSAAAFAKPEPSFTFTCAVNVCGEPTSFVAVNGLI